MYSLLDDSLEVDVELLHESLPHVEHHAVHVRRTLCRLAPLHRRVRVQLRRIRHNG